MTIIGEGLVAIRPETSGFASGVESKLQGILGGIPAPVAAITAGVAALGATAFAVGEKFQDSFNKIRVGTGASGDELKTLEGDFKNVLAGTAGSFEQVQEAITGIAARTGLSGAALDDFAKKEVTLGRITKTDVGDNVKSTTELFTLYGVNVADQSKKLDVLFKASQVGATSIGDLTSEVKAATPVAKTLGLTFDQTAALVANLSQAGIPAAKVMQGLGKEFTAAAKAGKDPLSVIADIEAQIKAAPDATAAGEIAFQKFGIRAGPQLAEALRSGRFDLQDTLRVITDGRGGINETGTAVSTLGGKFARLKNEIVVAMEPAGTAMVRFANEGMAKVLDILPKVFSALGAVYDLVVKGDFSGAFRRAFHIEEDSPIVGFLLRLHEILVSVVGFVEDHARPILIALGVAFLAMTSPVTLVIGGLVLLYTHFQFVRDAVAAVVSYLQDIFPKAAEAVTHVVNVIRDVVTVVLEAVRVYWAIWGDAIIAVVTAAFEFVRNYVETVIRIVADVIKLVLDLINGDWSAAWDDVKDILSAAWDFIRNAVEIGLNLVWDLVKALPGKLLGALASLAGDLGGVAADAMSSMYNSAVSGVGDLVGFVRSIPGRILDALGDLSNLLYNAGLAVIHGFLNGLKAAWGEVTGFVSGIAGWIADHKGPIEADRVLLVPHGAAIMDSLRAGLALRMNELTADLTRITSMIGDVGGSPSTPGLIGSIGPRVAAAVPVVASGASSSGPDITIINPDPSVVAAQVIAEWQWHHGG